MTDPSRTVPLPSFGLASFVLGIIGLLLFFLPILGGPISGLAVIAGIIGSCLAGIAGRGNLRWAVGGTAVSLLALGVNLAVAFAPSGIGARSGGLEEKSAVERPYTPPPSRWR